MAKIPSRTFRFFAVPLCLSGPEVKSREPRRGVSVCCWFSSCFQRVSTSSHYPAGKKGSQHFQNARDYSQIRRWLFPYVQNSMSQILFTERTEHCAQQRKCMRLTLTLKQKRFSVCREWCKWRWVQVIVGFSVENMQMSPVSQWNILVICKYI